MPLPSTIGFDLLQERREELGLKPLRGSAPSVVSLLFKGTGLAAVLLLLVFGLIAWGAAREGQLQEALDELEPVGEKVLRVEGQLKQLKAQTEAMQQDNMRIAEQLVAVRSGSGLLEQLKRVTPEGIQLKEVSATDFDINVVGEALADGSPGAFERINALQLNFSALPMVQQGGVKVVKINSDGFDPGNAGSVLRFTLEVRLDPDARASLESLRDLGATGLVQRYQLLQDYGVAL
ncbi:MAG: PilN domain-containing protein [Prochlorococcus sp.]|nr:PilN domain-containing protein [Prochlorococcus sp.]